MDDKFKKELIKLLDEQFDRKFISMFNQGFEEVVLPTLEELMKDVHTVKTRVNQIDTKLDLMNDKLLSHEHRIKIIEATPVVANQIKR